MLSPFLDNIIDEICEKFEDAQLSLKSEEFNKRFAE